MGIRLMVEVLDYAPDNLTPRERWALIAIAEDARDETRMCLKGIESNPVLARRLRVGRSERAAIIKALIDKGALERVKRGQKHQHAVFRIPRLAPVEQEPVVEEEPEDGGSQGPETSEAENEFRVRETGTQDRSQGPESPDAEDAQGPDSATSASGNCRLRVREPRTPSPQSPQDPSSLSGHERVVMEALADRGVTVEEMREIIFLIKRDHQPRSLAAYLRALAGNGDLGAYLERVRADAAERRRREEARRERARRAAEAAGEPGSASAQAREAALAAMREALGGRRGRRGSGGPVRLFAERQAPEVAERPEVQRARRLLDGRGDAAELLAAARERLGVEAPRGEVMLLAARLAEASARRSA